MKKSEYCSGKSRHSGYSFRYIYRLLRRGTTCCSHWGMDMFCGEYIPIGWDLLRRKAVELILGFFHPSICQTDWQFLKFSSHFREQAAAGDEAVYKALLLLLRYVNEHSATQIDLISTIFQFLTAWTGSNIDLLTTTTVNLSDFLYELYESAFLKVPQAFMTLSSIFFVVVSILITCE